MTVGQNRQGRRWWVGIPIIIVVAVAVGVSIRPCFKNWPSSCSSCFLCRWWSRWCWWASWWCIKIQAIKRFYTFFFDSRGWLREINIEHIEENDQMEQEHFRSSLDICLGWCLWRRNNKRSHTYWSSIVLYPTEKDDKCQGQDKHNRKHLKTVITGGTRCRIIFIFFIPLFFALEMHSLLIISRDSYFVPCHPETRGLRKWSLHDNYICLPSRLVLLIRLARDTVSILTQISLCNMSRM